MRFLPALVLFLMTAPALAQDLPASTAMRTIPAGEYTMGRQGSTHQPAHLVRVSAFELDEHEVTNAQYFAFCQETKRKLPAFWNVERFQCGEQWPDHPVIGVSLGAATAYAKWVGKRLPTEAEWEWAARGGGQGRFGDDHDSITAEQANYKKSPHDAPTDVKSYQPNGYGLYDMIGNVREWTTDYFSAEVPEASLVPKDGSLDGVVAVWDPAGPNKGHVGVVRGGGWYGGLSCQTVFTRVPYPRSFGDFAVGFRCARDVVEASHRDEVDQWHEGRIERLTAEDGWLSLVGLHEVPEGTSVVGSGEVSDIRIDGKVPERLGLLERLGGRLSFTPEQNSDLEIDGRVTTDEITVASDADGQPTMFRSGTVSFYAIARGDRFFLRVKDSKSEVRRKFKGVDRYLVADRWRVTARLETEGHPTEVPSVNVLGQETMQPSPGVLVFELQGRECRLTPVGEPGQPMFIVFADLTSGHETYGGGRFLSTAAPAADGTVVLDFNRATNPPCAFTPHATCPMPPFSNRLPVAVRSGEKRWGKKR